MGEERLLKRTDLLLHKSTINGEELQCEGHRRRAQSMAIRDLHYVCMLCKTHTQFWIILPSLLGEERQE